MAKSCFDIIMIGLSMLALFAVTSILGPENPSALPLGILAMVIVMFSDVIIRVLYYFMYSKPKTKGNLGTYAQKTYDRYAQLYEENGGQQAYGNNRFIIPIEHSDTRDLIPIGEDIIYSTLVSVKHREVDKRPTRTAAHLLCTTEGIAYKFFDSQGNLITRYLKYYEIRKIKLDKISIGWETLGFYRDDKRESKKDFEARQYYFFLTVIAHALESCKAGVESLSGTTDKDQIRKRKKMKSFVNTHWRKLEKYRKKAQKKGYV